MLAISAKGYETFITNLLFLLYREKGVPSSPDELPVGGCEVTEFPVSNLRFHALCTQCALPLDVLALPQLSIISFSKELYY